MSLEYNSFFDIALLLCGDNISLFPFLSFCSGIVYVLHLLFLP
ncbi:MAG: hypothetical protein DRN09_03380 [Thermoplasmata archaeon]|nr:MAG: hypothetical protein DRN09_03380 [Thermoplasmata archaeon]